MSKPVKNVLNPKYNDRILTYRKKAKKGVSPRPVRSYGRLITDEFVEAFLKHGTKKEIEERKKMFYVIDGKAQNKKGEKYLQDAGAADAGAADAGAADAGAADAGAADAGAADAGAADAGAADAGAADAGAADAGAADAGAADAGAADAGQGEPLYTENTVRFANESKVDQMLKDNLLNPADFADLKAKKDKLRSLTN